MRTYAAFPAAYSTQPTPYPGPSPSVFTQEPCRLSPQTSHPPTFNHSSDVQQYTIPPPLPPLGALHTLPPLRPEAEDTEYKFRRPSLPGAPDCQPYAPNRKATFDQGQPADYSPVPNHVPLSRHSADLPTSSLVEDRSAQYRSELAYTYPSSPRELTSNSDRPSSTVDIFQSIPGATGQDENTFAYNSSAAATTQQPHNNYSQISLPPPAQLFRSDPPTHLYAVRTSDDAASAIGPSRVDLAPLHSLQRRPYRRDPVDDIVLRSLGPRSG